jgi:hypothetical protein
MFKRTNRSRKCLHQPSNAKEHSQQRELRFKNVLRLSRRLFRRDKLNKPLIPEFSDLCITLSCFWRPEVRRSQVEKKCHVDPETNGHYELDASPYISEQHMNLGPRDEDLSCVLSVQGRCGTQPLLGM